MESSAGITRDELRWPIPRPTILLATVRSGATILFPSIPAFEEEAIAVDAVLEAAMTRAHRDEVAEPRGHCREPDGPMDSTIQNQEEENWAADAAERADLKFVAVNLGEKTAGGWYRELPDAQIEVLSRAQLERVPLDAADAETKARETIAAILTRHPRVAGTLE